ncbi:MAG: S8 family serine peptidase [Alphaproteobacteria bacterium]|nr:S8 family serine peptidase [Alphaproteobacteria bacterium]
MKSTGVLVKLAGSANGRPAAMAGLAPPDHEIKPLFTISADRPAAGTGLAAVGRTEDSWVLVTPSTESMAAQAASQHPWDRVHQVRRHFAARGREVLAAEPDLDQVWLPDPTGGNRLELAARDADRTKPDDQLGSPYAPGPRPNWHLGDDFSQLAAARRAVGDGPSQIKIVHLDTGYDPKHKACPAHIVHEEERNFVDASRPNNAEDETPTSGLLLNRGHGTGTIGILAAPQVNGLLDTASGKSLNGEVLGGAPMMRIVPVRIADRVFHFATSTVAQGIEYAVSISADVVSMSMGGLPSQAWADAANKAYEAGIVVVCAAGNNFGGLPTSLVVYPARFDRVIAACGVMADKTPYLNLPPEKMEGNAGPVSKMGTAVAAYTPNIPWARLGFSDWVDLDGGGTSAATPQVAAAAALWLHKNGGNYPAGDWQRAEAARRAIFDSAFLRDGASRPDRFLGSGLLRAMDALAIARPDNLAQLPRDSASFAFLHLLSSIFGVTGSEPTDLYALELTQLALCSRAAQDAMPDPEASLDQITPLQRRRFLQAILDEGKTSRALRDYLSRTLGQGGVATATLSPQARAPTRVALEAADAAPAPIDFAAAWRQILPPPPASRRLRIFATDPGASKELNTAFINEATVEVPWEAARSKENLLTPGPVGEYLEVVDVDPASACVYDPVDLNNPYLLAQDGLSPSEGNPQFHQQMVYAVAMRTIRNFEIALGRRALWAEREVPVAANHESAEADGGARTTRAFVRRLRLNPHALREANAYYSPDKRALLFGYFPADDTVESRQIVFTALSHDVVAHETTHALLDGIHRYYQQATNVDVPAFHEAFADIVAIFQHFTFPELLQYEIQRSRGDLAAQGDLMADLARQFGQAVGQIGQRGALRSAIGTKPSRDEYANAQEPHERGRVLLAAVFDAFLAIYNRRTQDLLRLASGGSGILQPGALHPDLVGRLAEAATKSAQHVLKLSIRALDYMPPVDPRFGDFLRALITADSDLVPNDRFGYRIAFIEAFGARGIPADGVRTLSPESLRWQTLQPDAQPRGLGDFIRNNIDLGWDVRGDRQTAWQAARVNAALLHQWLADPANFTNEQARAFGLNRSPPPAAGPDDFPHRDSHKRPRFEVHSVRPARRLTEDGEMRTDIIAVITQRRTMASEGNPDAEFRGGCTLVLDRREDVPPVRYCITVPVSSTNRAHSALANHIAAMAARGPYGDQEVNEPFAMLHRA